MTQRSVWSTVALENGNRPVPRFKQRARNVALTVAFILVSLASIEFFTSNYLRASTPYKHAMELIQKDLRVQAALGVPVVGGLTVSSRRNMARFLLSYRVHGPKASAAVSLLSETSLKAASITYLALTLEDGSKIVLIDERRDAPPS